MTKTLTAILEREGDGFVALCPELDIANVRQRGSHRVMQKKTANGTVTVHVPMHGNIGGITRGV